MPTTAIELLDAKLSQAVAAECCDAKIDHRRLRPGDSPPSHGGPSEGFGTWLIPRASVEALSEAEMDSKVEAVRATVRQILARRLADGHPPSAWYYTAASATREGQVLLEVTIGMPPSPLAPPNRVRPRCLRGINVECPLPPGTGEEGKEREYRDE